MRGLFAFVLLSALVVCARSVPLVFHRLLFGSEATVVFVGFSCGEPGGNEQMAHSQIVVVIVFSLMFEMDDAIVLHRRPL